MGYRPTVDEPQSLGYTDVDSEKRTAKERHRLGLLARLPMICGLAHLGDCGGELQSDHICEVQTLKRRRKEAALRVRHSQPPAEGDDALLAVSEDDLVADAANSWWLCESHHSRKWNIRIDRDWLPIEVEAFADEYGLTHYLERLTYREPASAE